MKQLIEITCIILVVLLLISTVACKQSPADATQQKPTDVTQQTQSNQLNQAPIDPLEGVLAEEEYAQIQTKINGIFQETHTDLLSYSGYVYFFEREQSDKLSETAGYKGIPVLITEIEKMFDEKERFNDCEFFAASVFALMRVDALESKYRERPGRRTCTKKGICLRYRDSQEQIPEILKMKINTEEKIEKLREFGILTVPYVLEEIEKGNDEYASYFTAIGLHMETPEYMIYMSDRDRLWGHGFEQEGFMDGSEDFDYKVWLSENEEDLNNLFKFLDAYCAEYEAEIAEE